MKKLACFVFFIFGSVIIYGQTDSIEKAIIFQKVQNKQIAENDYAIIGTKWIQTIKKIGNYPDLPLDQSGAVHYSFVQKFPGLNKEKIYSHILEWLSINYELFPVYLYSNLEDGKIVFHYSASLTGKSNVTYTSIISIKNEKILVEYINIGYQTNYEGHYGNDGYWVPELTVNLGLDKLCPIILQKSTEWNFDLQLLKLTNEFFKTDARDLSHFLFSYDSYNKF
jgi:hypothetical protein